MPPDAIRALPMALETSARRLTNARISASSRSISSRSVSISGTGWDSSISRFMAANSAFS
ncbi:Uncharacterised protein [Mycobacterium tuberculosis]|nr:Uncharacterised protein [Mycobacterium tuberculosis]